MSRPVPGWYPACAVVLVAAVCAVSLATGCAEGDAGEVCNDPNYADCDSHTGGEMEP